MAALINFTAGAVHTLAVRLFFSAVDGSVFLFSRRGAAVVMGAEALVLLRTAGFKYAASAGLKTALACILSRATWTFLNTTARSAAEHARGDAHGEGGGEDGSSNADANGGATAAQGIVTAAAAMESMWNWEPPDDPLAAGVWHVLRELAVTTNKVKIDHPKIGQLMSLPELIPAELASRMFYLNAVHEKESDVPADGAPVPEATLKLLQEFLPLANMAYECTTDAVLCAALLPRGFRLLGARYEAEIVASGCPAYYIALSTEESKKKEVVMCVRGTYSAEDVFTDLLAAGVAFSSGGGGTAHSGMAKAALFLADRFSVLLRSLQDAGFTVSLVGHSLGAGVTSLLSLVLLNAGLDPQKLRCVAYEPPACMDLHLSEACAAVVTSVVHADDVVPRMSAQLYIALLEELAAFDLEAAEAAGGPPLPTSLALMRHLTGLFTSSNPTDEKAGTSADEDGEAAAGEKADEAATELTEGSASQETSGSDKDAGAGSSLPSKYDPYVPGTVVYACFPPGEEASTATVVRRIISPADPVLRHIRVTSSMVSDHYIDRPKMATALGIEDPSTVVA